MSNESNNRSTWHVMIRYYITTASEASSFYLSFSSAESLSAQHMAAWILPVLATTKCVEDETGHLPQPTTAMKNLTLYFHSIVPVV